MRVGLSSFNLVSRVVVCQPTTDKETANILFWQNDTSEEIVLNCDISPQAETLNTGKLVPGPD